MAAKITFGDTFQIDDDGDGASLPQVTNLGAESIQTNAGFTYESQLIDNAVHTEIDLSHLTNPGRYSYRNNSTTQNLQIGIEVAAAFEVLDEILPGETSSGRIGPGVVPFALFTGGAPAKMQVFNADT